MTEEIRLIVWDLDETFWHGTLTEGGIRIRPDTCALVKDLAARGIMSSICSKNNLADVRAVLEREGVWSFFIFPSVDWESKGPRVAALVEAVQLRAPTVMFIDDNPMNLAEVAEAVPGIQVRSHDFIREIAASPLFVGKDDAGLSRLTQYKLLETRKRDEQATPGDNTEFLRRSEIRVYIEHDIASNIDRAIELINRTNQLNYTKRRLPEDPAEARRILLDQLRRFESQAGLVRVVDKYGDYGFVGFYLGSTGREQVVDGAAWQKLLYYCFSCRTLGMFVEQWLYEHMRRPELRTAGEVLTDLSIPRKIDWIRLVSSLDEDAAPVDKIAPEIRFHGGCEANAVAHYLAAHTDVLKVTGNFATGGLFVRQNGASLLLSACSRMGPAFEAEAARLDVPYHAMAFDYFGNAPEGTVFVFSGGMDETAGGHRYRHKEEGWELKIEPNGLPALDAVRDSDVSIRQIIRSRSPNSQAADALVATMTAIRECYETVTRGNDADLIESMNELCRNRPTGSLLVLVLGTEKGRAPDQTFKGIPWVIHYNAIIQQFASRHRDVKVIRFDDYIESDDEIHGFGHYDRMVYCRLAQGLVKIISGDLHN